MENENIRENENVNEEIVKETGLDEVSVEEEAAVTEDLAAEEAETEGAEAEDTETEDAEAEDAETEDVETEDAETEDIIGDQWQEETVDDAGYAAEETLTEEELATIAAAKKKKRNLIIAICAAVVVVAAFAAYWVCRVEGVGENTIVSNVLLENSGIDAKNDNIKYENPIMAALNSFTDKKDAVMTVNGKAVSKDVFEYATNTSGVNCVYSMLQTGIITDVKDVDWNEPAFGTKMTYTEYAKGLATENLVQIYSFIAEGEKRGIALTDEEEKEISDQIEELKSKYGDDFESALNQNGYPNEATLVELQRMQRLITKIYEDAEKDLSKYVSTEELQTAEGDDEKVTVKHILISFDDEGLGDVTDAKRAAAKAEAEEVLKKLNDGGDFDKLMEEYNDDPGATPEGYTFADDGTMVQQFTDASFALEVGETSGLVETSYGYHIIQRMERRFNVDDYITYLTKNADVRIRKGNYAKAAVTLDLEAVFGTAAE